MRRLSIAAAVAAAALAPLALSAGATAPPVGPLPKGPVTLIQVQHGQLFALVLPKPSSKENVWRGARPIDTNVVRPQDEGELKGNIVLVYKALHAGKTDVIYALTKGETERALKSQTFKVTVT